MSLVCQAKVDMRGTKPLIIPVDRYTPQVTQKTVSNWVPTNMAPSSDQNQVMARIADRSFSSWFNSPEVKATTLGKTAQTVQENMKADVEVPATSPAGVKHKFSFRVEAFQALAKLEYTGWTKCVFDYDAKSSSSEVQLSEKLFDNKDLVVSHKSSSEQDLSFVALRWDW